MVYRRNRHSTRLPNWDYSSIGYYFVTLCTQERECLFGEIKNEMMILNNVGVLIDKWWNTLPNKYDEIALDEYQIMPNHVHGIIIINKYVGVSFMKPDKIKSNNEKINQIAKSHHHMGLLNDKGVIREMGVINHAPTKIVTLGHIIRYFKAKTSYELHKQGFNQKIWQRNFYERIIRNEKELFKIQKYIKYNPLMWERDRNNMDNINFV